MPWHIERTGKFQGKYNKQSIMLHWQKDYVDSHFLEEIKLGKWMKLNEDKEFLSVHNIVL